MELQTKRNELIYKNPTNSVKMHTPLAPDNPSAGANGGSPKVVPTDAAMRPHQRILVTIAALGCVIAVCGCEKVEPIREYRINKTVPTALQGSDRMLAAIIPGGDQAWFYKVSGPSDAVGFAERDIRSFIAAAKFENGEPQIGDLPSEWVQETEKRPMRFATVLINTPSKQLELAISSLPKSGDWDEQVALNVNRWRGQMKLADSADRWAGAEELKLENPAEQPAVWVDLSGEMGAGPAMPPMAGGGPFTGPFAGASAGGDGMPSATNSTAGSTAAAGATGAANSANPDSGLKYDVPDGWRAGKMSMMRLAAFDIGPQEQPAELTIIQAGGDLRGNVDRWLGQVRGDSPPADVVDAALAAAERLTVSGREAQRFYLSDGKGDESSGQMIDATIVPLDNGISMFIKATGPAETVVAQRDAIAKFLKSLAIPQ